MLKSLLLCDLAVSSFEIFSENCGEMLNKSLLTVNGETCLTPKEYRKIENEIEKVLNNTFDFHVEAGDIVDDENPSGHSDCRNPIRSSGNGTPGQNHAELMGANSESTSRHQKNRTRGINSSLNPANLHQNSVHDFQRNGRNDNQKSPYSDSQQDLELQSRNLESELAPDSKESHSGSFRKRNSTDLGPNNPSNETLFHGSSSKESNTSDEDSANLTNETEDHTPPSPEQVSRNSNTVNQENQKGLGENRSGDALSRNIRSNDSNNEPEFSKVHNPLNKNRYTMANESNSEKVLSRKTNEYIDKLSENQGRYAFEADNKPRAFTQKIENTTKSENCYIATFGTQKSQAINTLLENNAEIGYIYAGRIDGVSFCLKDQKSYQIILDSRDFASLEPDSIFHSSSIQSHIPDHMFSMQNYDAWIFRNRILDSFYFRILGLRSLYKYLTGVYRYNYTGKGVRIHMIDTSVDTEHPDIKGRVMNTFSENLSCNSHGTFVSLLIAGKKYGFAKDGLIDVLNVVDCDGRVRLSTLIFALNKQKFQSNVSSILYFGVSGPRSEMLNDVVNKISQNKVIVITSAGNEKDLGCNYSPGSAFSSINVGSIDANGNVSSFSNYNSCIRIYSLGENIRIAHKIQNSETSTLMGTSFSAALIASASAAFLESKRTATTEDVWAFLARNSIMRNNFMAFTFPEIFDGKTSSPNQDSETVSCWPHIIFWSVFIFFLLGLGFLVSKLWATLHGEPKSETRKEKI